MPVHNSASVLVRGMRILYAFWREGNEDASYLQRGDGGYLYEATVSRVLEGDVYLIDIKALNKIGFRSRPRVYPLSRLNVRKVLGYVELPPPEQDVMDLLAELANEGPASSK